MNRWKKNLLVGVVIFLVGIFAEACVSSALGQAQAPSRPPEEVIAQWEQVGATFGWMGVEQGGFPIWRSAQEKFATLPAFRFNTIPAGRLKSLPLPQTSFGLWLSQLSITDEGLAAAPL